MREARATQSAWSGAWQKASAKAQYERFDSQSKPRTWRTTREPTVDSVENYPLPALEVLRQSQYRRFQKTPSERGSRNMYRLLLIDQDAIHAERLAVCLRQRGLAVMIDRKSTRLNSSH